MSDDVMQVDLVAADRLVWSGEAKMVIARTSDGDVGVLPNHAPMLSVLVESVVEVRTTDDEEWVAAVDSGFLSVARNCVAILAEQAEMSHEIDLEHARNEVERLHSAGEDEDEARRELARQEARVRAAERSA